MRLLLYGGTFDPPHNGHLNNLRAAAGRVLPDLAVVMPEGGGGGAALPGCRACPACPG